MQFIITGYDGKDEGAFDRRMKARDKHLESAASLANEGNLLYATALLDKSEKMIGSVMIMEFSSREKLDKYLKNEPYVLGNVWEQIDIKQCKVPSLFNVQRK